MKTNNLRKAIENGNYENLPAGNFRKEIKRQLLLECDIIDECNITITNQQKIIHESRNNIKRICKDCEI